MILSLQKNQVSKLIETVLANDLIQLRIYSLLLHNCNNGVKPWYDYL